MMGPLGARGRVGVVRRIGRSSLRDEALGGQAPGHKRGGDAEPLEADDDPAEVANSEIHVCCSVWLNRKLCRPLNHKVDGLDSFALAMAP
jgi:hypothetical protein